MIGRLFPGDHLMHRIVACESNFVHYTTDGDVLRGRVTPADTGVMQINLDIHGKRVEQLGLNVEKLEDNLKYGKMLYDESGHVPWVCLRHIARN